MTRFLPVALALLFCFPLSATADNATPSPPVTTADVVHAALAARGTLAPGAYKILETSSGGGLVSATILYRAGDDWIEHTSVGPFTTAAGRFQERTWRENENGIVTRDSAPGHDDDPSDLGLLLLATTARDAPLRTTLDFPPLYVIGVTQPNGDRSTLYFDTTTFLLTKMVTRGHDQLQHVSTFSDYRRVFGEMRAFHITYSDGRSDNDTDTTISAFEATTDVPDFHIPETRNVVIFPSTDPVALPVRFEKGQIVVRATINGRGLDFLLDTGAGAGMAIDPGVAHQLGLTEYGRRSATIGGSFDIGRTIVPDIAIGSLHMHQAIFREIPIDDKLYDANVVGLLGYDFIKGAIVAIDCKKQTVVFYPPGTTLPNQTSLVTMPITLDNGAPRLGASFSGIPGSFLIDTGAPSIILFQHYVDQVPKVSPALGQVSMQFIGGSVTGKMFYINDLRFGSTHFERVDALVPQSSTVEMPGYDGIIGRSVLNFYTVYLDYANMQIYLQRN